MVFQFEERPRVSLPHEEDPTDPLRGQSPAGGQAMAPPSRRVEGWTRRPVKDLGAFRPLDVLVKCGRNAREHPRRRVPDRWVPVHLTRRGPLAHLFLVTAAPVEALAKCASIQRAAPTTTLQALQAGVVRQGREGLTFLLPISPKLPPALS